MIEDYGIDLSGCEKSEHGTLLFEIDFDGETAWVSAANHVRALIVAAEHSILDGMWWRGHVSIEAPQRVLIEKRTFRDDDTGETRSMWDEWKRDTSERLVACSVY